MQVLLLGPVTVVAGEREQHVSSSRQAALLAVLAMQPGRHVARGALVEAVWGDDPPATARNTLQVHASALRRLLGSEAVTSSGDGYRLDPACEVDTRRFDELVKSGVEEFRSGRWADASRRLRSALALWRGDPMTHVESAWFDAERERLRQQWLTANLTRIDADLALGRHLLVLDDVAALAQANPFDEAVAARLVLALYRNGWQARALAAYERIRAVLDAELGVEPGPALRQLHQRVLRQSPELDLAQEARALQSPWVRTLEVGRTAIVGREALLAGLVERLGRTSVVNLVGPSGIGKTRLATELARRLEGSFAGGAAVLRCPDVEGSLASALATQLDDVSASTEADATPTDVLVVLDDVGPCADRAAEIGDLASRSRGCRWVLTSTRPVRGIDAHVVSVPPLDRDPGETGAPSAAVELLVERAVAAGASAPQSEADLAAAARCAEILDGIPLALEVAAPSAVLGYPELAAQLAASELAGDGLAVSFASSLDRLDELEWTLMQLLVSCGGSVDLELIGDMVRALGGRPDPAVVATLVRDGLVRKSRGSHGFAMFDVNDATRAHVRSRMPAGAADGMGTALVEAMAVTMGSGPLLLPSYLWTAEQGRRRRALLPVATGALVEARRLGLVGPAAEFVLSVYELHLNESGVEDAFDLYDWLLAAPELAPHRRIDLGVATGLMHGAAGHPDEATRRIAGAIAAARSVDDAPRLAVALTMANFLALGNDANLPDHSLGEAEQVARATGVPEILASVLSIPTLASGDLVHLDEAVRVARGIGHRGLEMLARANLADMALTNGDTAVGLNEAVEAGAIAADMHNAYMAGQMAGVVRTVRAITDPSAALTTFGEALAAVRAGDVRTVTDALQKIAAAAHHRGERSLADRAVGIYRVVLAREGIEASRTELDFAATWLSGYGGVVPDIPVEKALDDLIRSLQDA